MTMKKKKKKTRSCKQGQLFQGEELVTRQTEILQSETERKRKWIYRNGYSRVLDGLGIGIMIIIKI